LLPPWPLLHADAINAATSNAAAEADVRSLITARVCRVGAEPRRRPDDESTPNRCRTATFDVCKVRCRGRFHSRNIRGFGVGLAQLADQGVGFDATLDEMQCAVDDVDDGHRAVVEAADDDRIVVRRCADGRVDRDEVAGDDRVHVDR
jgi:hypothetical protein